MLTAGRKKEDTLKYTLQVELTKFANKLNVEDKENDRQYRTWATEYILFTS